MKQFADLRRLVAESRIQKGRARNLDGVIEVLEVGFARTKINATQCLERPRFLDIKNIVGNAELRAYRFVAQDGEFHNDGQRVQYIEAVIGVFGIIRDIGAGHIYISRGENLYAVATRNGFLIIIYMSSFSEKKHKSDETPEECPVCMEDMTKNKIKKTFSCGKHKSCGKCYAGIMTTNTQNRACPLCRTEEQELNIEEWTQRMYAYRDKLSNAELLKLLDIMTEHKSRLNPEDIPEDMYRDLPPKASSTSSRASSAKPPSPTDAELRQLAHIQRDGSPTSKKRKSRRGGQKKRGTKKRM